MAIGYDEIYHRRLGTRYAYGTDWPVYNTVHRVEGPRGRVEWVTTHAICDGVAGYARRFRTRKAAMEDANVQ